MQEKRQHLRQHLPGIILKIKDGENYRRRYFRDLSRGGIYIQTHDVRNVGEVIALRLEPPGWQSVIDISGRVAHVTHEQLPYKSQPTGMGVAFIDLSAEALALLDRLLAELGPSVIDPRGGADR